MTNLGVMGASSPRLAVQARRSVGRATGWSFPEDFGAVADAGITDNTAALQAWIDNTTRGRGMTGRLQPDSRYGFYRQLIVPEDAHIIGAGPQSEFGHQGASELQWYGPSGVNAIVTALTSENNWSRGQLSDFGLVNKATSNAAGWGLHVRNPQNCATISNIRVSGFPDGACLVEETKTTGTVGDTPGVFFIDRCFFVGGKTPLKIRNGSQPVTVDRTAVDTDAATVTAGVLVSAGPVSSTGPRAPIGFRATKVEVATSTTTDVPAWQVTADVPVHWDTCQAQRNAGLGTRGVIEHTNTTKKWPRFTISNLSSWDFAYSLRLLSAGFDLVNPGSTAPWGVNFDWLKGEMLALTFTHSALVNSMSSVAIPLAGVGFNAGMPILLPAVLAGVSVTSSTAVTAGTLTVSLIKNGSTFITSTTLTTSITQRRQVSLIEPDLQAATPANQLLVAGDRVTAQVTTTSDFTPASGAQLAVTIYLRMYSNGS